MSRSTAKAQSRADLEEAGRRKLEAFRKKRAATQKKSSASPSKAPCQSDVELPGSAKQAPVPEVPQPQPHATSAIFKATPSHLSTSDVPEDGGREADSWRDASSGAGAQAKTPVPQPAERPEGRVAGEQEWAWRRADEVKRVEGETGPAGLPNGSALSDNSWGRQAQEDRMQQPTPQHALLFAAEAAVGQVQLPSEAGPVGLQPIGLESRPEATGSWDSTSVDATEQTSKVVLATWQVADPQPPPVAPTPPLQPPPPAVAAEMPPAPPSPPAAPLPEPSSAAGMDAYAALSDLYSSSPPAFSPPAGEPAPADGSAEQQDRSAGAAAGSGQPPAERKTGAAASLSAAEPASEDAAGSAWRPPPPPPLLFKPMDVQQAPEPAPGPGSGRQGLSGGLAEEVEPAASGSGEPGGGLPQGMPSRPVHSSSSPGLLSLDAPGAEPGSAAPPAGPQPHRAHLRAASFDRQEPGAAGSLSSRPAETGSGSLMSSPTSQAAAATATKAERFAGLQQYILELEQSKWELQRAVESQLAAAHELSTENDRLTEQHNAQAMQVEELRAQLQSKTQLLQDHGEAVAGVVRERDALRHAVEEANERARLLGNEAVQQEEALLQLKSEMLQLEKAREAERDLTRAAQKQVEAGKRTSQGLQQRIADLEQDKKNLMVRLRKMALGEASNDDASHRPSTTSSTQTDPPPPPSPPPSPPAPLLPPPPDTAHASVQCSSMHWDAGGGVGDEEDVFVPGVPAPLERPLLLPLAALEGRTASVRIAEAVLAAAGDGGAGNARPPPLQAKAAQLSPQVAQLLPGLRWPGGPGGNASALAEAQLQVMGSINDHLDAVQAQMQLLRGRLAEKEAELAAINAAGGLPPPPPQQLRHAANAVGPHPSSEAARPLASAEAVRDGGSSSPATTPAALPVSVLPTAAPPAAPATSLESLLAAQRPPRPASKEPQRSRRSWSLFGLAGFLGPSSSPVKPASALLLS